MNQATPRQAGRFLALTLSGALIVSFALFSPVAQAQDATPSGAPLAAQVGFSDPVLDKLQTEGVNTLGESLEFKAFNHKYRLISLWELQSSVPFPIGGAGLVFLTAEADLDDTIVLTVNDIRGEMAMGLPNCCGPHATRYYDWRNDKISDASAQHSDKYFGTLGDALYQLTTQKFDDAAQYSARLLELLMAYDAIGQRDAGWSLAQMLANSALAAKRVPANGYLEKVFLPTEKQLYDQHKPFEVPDLVTGPQPSQSDDLYSKSQSVE